MQRERKQQLRGWALGLLTALVLLAAACSFTGPSRSSSQSADTTRVYLVRHAEKADGSNDPGLTEQGRARAESLARLLSKQPIDRLWTSDYARTRQTLMPLSRARKIPLTVYDVRDSSALVARVMRDGAGQTHVIAGHSNTIPGLVDLLEAWPEEVTTRREDLGHQEYNRLYEVLLTRGKVTRVLERRFRITK